MLEGHFLFVFFLKMQCYVTFPPQWACPHQLWYAGRSTCGDSHLPSGPPFRHARSDFTSQSLQMHLTVGVLLEALMSCSPRYYRMCISYSSLRRLSMMLTRQRRGHFGILHEECRRTWGSCSAFMGNSPSSSSHERGTNGLTVEMRGEERENQCFCWGKERTAFTGLCIIKQLRKLIRVWGGGMRISQLIISMATTAPVDDLREDSASKASESF